MKMAVAGLVVSISLTACGVVLLFKLEGIQILTPGVTGATCELTDKRGRKWTVTETPATVEVTSGAAPLTVICQHRGYKPAVVLAESVGFWQNNDHRPLGGVTPVELASAQRYYPMVVEVWMERSTWPSEEERKKWLEKKARARLANAQAIIETDLPPPSPANCPTPEEGGSVEEDWLLWMKEK